MLGLRDRRLGDVEPLGEIDLRRALSRAVLGEVRRAMRLAANDDSIEHCLRVTRPTTTLSCKIRISTTSASAGPAMAKRPTPDPDEVALVMTDDAPVVFAPFSAVVAQMKARCGMTTPMQHAGHVADPNGPDSREHTEIAVVGARSLSEALVGELGLSVRSMTCLTNAGVKTVAQLVSLTADSLLTIANFGITSLANVQEQLARHGLRLTNVPSLELDHDSSAAAKTAAMAQLVILAKKYVGAHGDGTVGDLVADFARNPGLYAEAAVLFATPLTTIAGGTAEQHAWPARITQAFAALNDREQEILAFRAPIENQCTLEEVGSLFNLTRERIRQLEGSAVAKLARDPVIAHAARRFEEVAYAGCTPTRLAAAGFPVDGVDVGLLVHVVRWLQLSKGTLRTAEAFGVRWVCLGSAEMCRNLVPTNVVAEVIVAEFPEGTGSREALHDKICSRIAPYTGGDRETTAITDKILDATSEDLSWEDDTWHFRGGTVIDRAVRLLTAHGGPMTRAELCAGYGATDDRDCNHLMGRISESPRFKYVVGRKWALTEMNVEPYKNLDVWMAELIDDNGGRMSLRRLQRNLSGEFAEASVAMYAMAGTRFILDGDVVRLRTAADPLPDGVERSARLLRVVGGLYDGRWAFHFDLSYDAMLRSSTAGPPALCSLFDVSLDGDHSTLDVVGGGTIVAACSFTGVLLHTTGGLRDKLREIGAVDGDRVRVIAVDRQHVAIEVVPKCGDTNPLERLMSAIGVARSDDIAGDLAQAIGLERDADGDVIAGHLARRGDPLHQEFLAMFPEYDEL